MRTLLLHPNSTVGVKEAITVTGFDEDTKEEELIAFFYRYVYGGGLRNINDGKV